MKKILFTGSLLVVILIIISALHKPQLNASPSALSARTEKSGSYIIIAWNDLGMHCANRYFGNICILPPYNNQRAQVIKVGDAANLPQVMTYGMNVMYQIPGNTYSVGKTDFWTYCPQLFGITLPNDTGLTGKGLSGTMTMTDNYFVAEGIPVTPFTDSDLVNEHPFQLTLINVYDASSTLLASTQSVIPVSNEINCISSGCHSSEQDILNKHELVPGFNPSVKPVLCANCHQDNALNKPGTPGTPVFSEAIHTKHGGLTNDCYKCHPGPNTQCFRDIMKSKGMVCQDCHGSVDHVGQTISNGRQAWLQEPDCGAVACHGPQHAPEAGKLYRNSKGHGNLYCSSCHGSPHAIVPTTQANDNVQNIALQGYQGTLNSCVVCHGIVPTGPGPHGLIASVLDYTPAKILNDELFDIVPNPLVESSRIAFNICEKENVSLMLYDINGKPVKVILSRKLLPGSYSTVLQKGDLSSGIYFYSLQSEKIKITKKLIIAN